MNVPTESENESSACNIGTKQSTLIDLMQYDCMVACMHLYVELFNIF